MRDEGQHQHLSAVRHTRNPRQPKHHELEPAKANGIDSTVQVVLGADRQRRRSRQRAAVHGESAGAFVVTGCPATCNRWHNATAKAALRSCAAQQLPLGRCAAAVVAACHAAPIGQSQRAGPILELCIQTKRILRTVHCPSAGLARRRSVCVQAADPPRVAAALSDSAQQVSHPASNHVHVCKGAASQCRRPPRNRCPMSHVCLCGVPAPLLAFCSAQWQPPACQRGESASDRNPQRLRWLRR